MKIQFTVKATELAAVVVITTSILGFAQTTPCPVPPNKVVPTVSAAVGFSLTQGLFTYSYTVANSATSQQDIDSFAVDFEPPTSLVLSPSGWTFGVFDSRSSLGWAATLVSATAPDDGVSIPPSIVQIKPGNSLAGFSFQSPNAPGFVKYFVSGFSPISIQQGEEGAETLVETCPQSIGNLLDLAVVGSTVGPTNALPILIDIKPGTYPNPINPRDQGVVPVAILGSATFDVTQVNITSLRFGPGGATASDKQGTFEDVNGDGYIDLLVHFPVPAIGLRCNDTALFLLGNLVQGAPIGGADSVVTVGCH